jgi:long-chain acyl-CoA synthetase
MVAKNFKSWPKGWPKSLNYPEIPVYEFLNQTAMRVPNRIAIVYYGTEVTYGELKELSGRFAAALYDMGVRKGDRVAIHMLNCPQFAIAYYGIVKIGAVYTPLSPLLSPRESAHQLSDSGAETLISMDILLPNISSIIPETSIKRIITTSLADSYSPVVATLKPVSKAEVPDTADMISLLKRHEARDIDVQIDVKKDLVHLAYTGGTTGISKAVMITHANVVSNVIQAVHWKSGAQIEMVDGKLTIASLPDADTKDDITSVFDQETSMVVVPWFHALGTIGYLNMPVYNGSTMVVFSKFDPKEYLEALGKYKVTTIGGAPQLFIPLINHPDFDSYNLSGITGIGCGAAPLPMPVIEKLLDVTSGVLCEAYGLTECTMGATYNPYSREAFRAGSVGLPVFDTEVKLVDLETGEELPEASEGEICIRGPQVMAGYFNKPEETAAVLKDGWLFTGDIGRFDEDGFLYITDRKKDLIIYKGYNVYPRDLEDVIFKHPAVQQCAVVGKPDPDAGELPVAFIELKQGEKATKEEMIEFVNSKIAHYKKIRDVIFMDQIPASAAGKILKKEIRKLLE